MKTTPQTHATSTHLSLPPAAKDTDPDTILSARAASKLLNGTPTRDTICNWCRSGHLKGTLHREGPSKWWSIRLGDLLALPCRKPREKNDRAVVERNREIARLHGEGKTQAVIAARFYITPARVGQILRDQAQK